MIGSVHAADNPVLGEWRVEDGAATVKIVECNGRLWGVVASEKTPGGFDRMNPNASKRSRPTLGIPVLINMKKSSDERNKWEGNIYNAKDGKTYEASVQLKSPTALVVEGCVLSILCGGQTWTRVDATATPGAKGAPAGAPSVTGSSPSAQKAAVAGQKPGAAPISDVCLLPEIAGAAH